VTNYLRPGMAELTPAYYPQLLPLERFKAWIKVTSLPRAEHPEVERLAMHTTGSQLVRVLRKSMLSFGSVYLESKDLQTVRTGPPRKVV
jgi:hypothetical protein